MEERDCPLCGRKFEVPADHSSDAICEFHNEDGSIDEEYVAEVEGNRPLVL